MPGIYKASPKSKQGGRAGLALPFTPTTGPIRFQQDTTGYYDSPMFNPTKFMQPSPWVGKIADLKGGGIVSESMQACVIVCIAELRGSRGANPTWPCGFFVHLQGGQWDYKDNEKIKLSFESFVDDLVKDKSDCYSLVISNDVTGSTPSIEKILGAGFPANKMSVYIANASVIDVAVEFNTMGEFGETRRGGKGKEPGPYGIINKEIRKFYDLKI